MDSRIYNCLVSSGITAVGIGFLLGVLGGFMRDRPVLGNITFIVAVAVILAGAATTVFTMLFDTKGNK